MKWVIHVSVPGNSERSGNISWNSKDTREGRLGLQQCHREVSTAPLPAHPCAYSGPPNALSFSGTTVLRFTPAPHISSRDQVLLVSSHSFGRSSHFSTSRSLPIRLVFPAASRVMVQNHNHTSLLLNTFVDRPSPSMAISKMLSLAHRPFLFVISSDVPCARILPVPLSPLPSLSTLHCLLGTWSLRSTFPELLCPLHLVRTSGMRVSQAAGVWKAKEEPVLLDSRPWQFQQLLVWQQECSGSRFQQPAWGVAPLRGSRPSRGSTTFPDPEMEAPATSHPAEASVDT